MGSYTPIRIEEKDGALLLPVRAHPGASKNQVGGEREGALQVRVSAPPERGRANQAIGKLLAGALGIPRSAVELVRGSTSRDKMFCIRGLTRAELEERLSALGR
ncbi:MAG: DUF167 domain-containing protein [Planctomycetota bacterium]